MRRSLSQTPLMLALLLGFSQAAWPQEWEKVLELAKREGKLAMIGPTGSDRRDAMANLFQKSMGSRWNILLNAGQASDRASLRNEARDCMPGTWS